MNTARKRRVLWVTTASALSLLGALGAPSVAHAAVIDVSPTDTAQDNIAKIESAAPGDEVVVQPGTYAFRLYLEGQGTAAQPIVIRAADPTNRPVWDLAGDTTANFPGSYTGGDNGRAIWQITGAYYQVSGIVFRNGTDGNGNGGGIRFKFSDHVTLHDCLFQYNDNGIQGSGTNTLVEFCEFAENGDPNLSEGSHNLYIHGGSLTVRYCYIHDARKSQNMHIRANDSVFEYNWIARSHSYMGDMMPCTMDPCDPVHRMLLRGNVFVRGTPTNDGQVFVMYNDQADPGVTFELSMINNTIIGNGDGAALVHFANDTGDIAQETAVLNNNAVVNVARIFRVDGPGLSNYSASGTHNWLSDGTADTTGLNNTVTGADAGFADAASDDFVPAAGSPLIAAGDDTLTDLPDKEYFQNEQNAMMWRERLSVLDIGAFESTTDGTPQGPYGPATGGGGSGTGGAGVGGTGTGGTATGGTGGAGQTPVGQTEDDGGCGCRMAAADTSAPRWLALGLLTLLLGLARRSNAGTSPTGRFAAGL